MMFIRRKMWFILSLLCFMVSQAVLPNLHVDDDLIKTRDIILFSLRVINYCSTMRAAAVFHTIQIYRGYRQKRTIDVGGVPVPAYLKDGFQQANLTLTLCFVWLLIHEPMLWCTSDINWPVDTCHASRNMEARYKVISMVAMIVIWGLCVDMSVLSTGLSAFALVCTYVLGEVIQFLIGLTFLLLMFASSLSALRHVHQQFRDVPNCALSLFAITVMRYEGDYREINDEPVLLGGVFLFVLASGVLLLNLLIAQLNCSYEFVYQDMVGFARLNRASCIVECMTFFQKAKWQRFVESLQFDKKLEFNEGDIGMAGGLQTYEASSLHPTAEDTILRYGGSCSPAEKWPDDAKETEKMDRFERMEKLLHKAMKRMVKTVAASHVKHRGDTTLDDSMMDDDMGSLVESVHSTC